MKVTDDKLGHISLQIVLGTSLKEGAKSKIKEFPGLRIEVSSGNKMHLEIQMDSDAFFVLKIWWPISSGFTTGATFC